MAGKIPATVITGFLGAGKWGGGGCFRRRENGPIFLDAGHQNPGQGFRSGLTLGHIRPGHLVGFRILGGLGGNGPGSGGRGLGGGCGAESHQTIRSGFLDIDMDFHGPSGRPGF